MHVGLERGRRPIACAASNAAERAEAAGTVEDTRHIAVSLERVIRTIWNYDQCVLEKGKMWERGKYLVEESSRVLGNYKDQSTKKPGQQDSKDNARPAQHISTNSINMYKEEIKRSAAWVFMAVAGRGGEYGVVVGMLQHDSRNRGYAPEPWSIGQQTSKAPDSILMRWSTLAGEGE